MTIPTNGLDFYLPFDADMDEKIHSLTGTLSSSSAATYFMLSSDTAVGKFLRCIKTQGSSSYYLKYPGSESLMQYGTGDFSLSFWMRAPDWGNFTHVVFEKKYNDNYDGFVVFKVLDPLNLCCRLRKGSGEDSVDILTASAANSDKFIHWCFVRDAGGGRWYCNGLQEATSGELINECIEGGCNVDPGRAIGVDVSNSEIFKIGYSASWPSKQAVFDLKALRIYNRALSDSEITELSKEFSGTSSLDTVLLALDGARDALVMNINAKGGNLADNATLYQCAETVGSLSGGGASADIVKLTVASGSTGEQISNVFSQIPDDLQGKTYAVKFESGEYILTSSIIMNHSNGKILLYCDSFTDFDNMPVTLNASALELIEGSYAGLQLEGSAGYEIRNMKFLDTRSGSDSKNMIQIRSTSFAYIKNCCLVGYNGDYANDYWGIIRSSPAGEAVDETLLSPMVIANCHFNNIHYAAGNVKDAFTLTYMRDTTGNVNRCFTTFGKSKGALIYHNVQGSVWDTSKTMSLDFPVDGVFTDLDNAL